MRCILVVGLATFLFCSVKSAFAQKSDAMVKVTTTATKPDERGVETITLELAIEPGWHIYANPVLSDFFKSGQTDLKVVSKGKVEEFKVVYPPGIRKEDKDPDIGKYAIYENKVTLKATLKRPQAEALVLGLRVMACSDKKMQCLPLATITIKVP